MSQKIRIVLESGGECSVVDFNSVVAPLIEDGWKLEVKKMDMWHARWERSFRGGDLESVYIVDERGRALLEAIGDREIPLGEVLGKHSDVCIPCPHTLTPTWSEETGPLGYRHITGQDPIGILVDEFSDSLPASEDVWHQDDPVPFERFLAWLKA